MVRAPPHPMSAVAVHLQSGQSEGNQGRGEYVKQQMQTCTNVFTRFAGKRISFTAHSPSKRTEPLTLVHNKPRSDLPPPDAGSTPCTLACPWRGCPPPRFRLPGTCVALKERKRSLLQRISLCASTCNRKERKPPVTIDISHRRSIVRPWEDMMASQEQKEAFQE